MDEQTNYRQLPNPEQLSTSELEDIIRADFYGTENYSEETIQHVLALIAKRKQEEQPESVFDPEKGWCKLQLLIEEKDTDSAAISSFSEVTQKKPFKGKKLLRRMGLIAACLATAISLLCVAQALGLNILGALGRWTDETFQFIFSSSTGRETTVSVPAEGELQEALAEMGLPVQLAPTWIPSDYEPSEIVPVQTDLFKGVFAAYTKPNMEHSITISVIEFFDAKMIDDIVFEKSPGDPEIYIHSGMQFYVFKNSETWKATWSGMGYVITIGAESRDNVLSIIQSIQEVTR